LKYGNMYCHLSNEMIDKGVREREA
jgi:hypothetical protein